jgi:hypothetical protein
MMGVFARAITRSFFNLRLYKSISLVVLLLLLASRFMHVNGWLQRYPAQLQQQQHSTRLITSTKSHRRQDYRKHSVPHLGTILRLQHQDQGISPFGEIGTPPLIVWQRIPTSESSSTASAEWTRVVDHGGLTDRVALKAAQMTYNWSSNFVQKLELCPWAKTSLETPNAMHFFVVQSPQNEASSSRIVEQVARRFVHDVMPNHDYAATLSPLERAAIYFVLFLPVDSWMDDFGGFYDWFSQLEEEWDDEELQHVIIAPFHPDWEFAAADDQEQVALSYEKKSPVPLVSLVSARVVEQAGESVTAKIAHHNQQVLLDQTKVHGNDALEQLWQAAIHTPGNN